MCMQDEPPYDNVDPLYDNVTFTAPEPTRPRTYRLSGDRPATPVERHAMDTRRGSVALAVLGEMLNEAETVGVNPFYDDPWTEALQQARRRIAAAEAAL